MHPRLFTIGSFTQHTYGLLVAIAFMVALYIAVRLGRRDGLDGDQVFNLGVYMAVVGVIGSKALLILTDLSYYTRNPGQIFSLESLQAGGVFYGGLLSAVFFAVWYLHNRALPFLKTGDAFAPGVALGHAIGRLGCFSAGCCYGKPTSLPWGITFKDPYAHEMFGTPIGIPLHPTQLYEAVAETLIFFLLMWRWKRKSFDGQVLTLYLAVYGAVRFCLEFVRDDPDRGFVFGGWMSTSQFIAIILIVLAGAIWSFRHNTPPERVRPARSTA